MMQSILPPVSVALCPTSFCVRQCNFCSNTQRNEEKRKFNSQYSESIFSQIIEDLNDLKVLGISIAGGGEPLVYDKSAFTRFLIQQNHSFKIGIHTNGVLLEKILTQEVITAGNIQYINVSVIAHEEELYKQISRASGEQFAKIEKNLKQAIELQKRHKNFPTFGVKILICRDNYRRIKDMSDYFLNMGINNILIRCVGNFEADQDVELLDSQYSELTSIFKEDLKMSNDQIWAVTGRTFSASPIPSRCWIVALQYTAGVDPDGEVYLCSPWSQKEYSIGNVNKKRIRSLWGSKKHKEIAETLNCKMRTGQCNPLLCRHYHSNLAIDGFIGGLIELLQKTKIEDDYGRFI